jgi:signal peptidase I
MKRRFSPAAWRGLFLGLVLLWALRQWVCMPVIIVGESMAPMLHSGQLTAVNKLAYRSVPPRRGDVVAVWTGQDLVVKRIVGLPNEEICARCGTFYVDGKPLAEPYVRVQGLSEFGPGKIDPECFVIAGDNRSETFIGVVRRGRIVGRLMTWPAPFWASTPADGLRK